ncbi:uncharacterized protein METZ01_LOCUS60029 [marine metagenome]|uniref:Uncharacterized protein n=1 Tax=marine metagenome TaxID=408172 RepID=A0A381ST00_9ZZZZ
MALTGVRTMTVKTYSITQNFGTETRELEHSTVVRYNSNDRILDSTLYAHNIPLNSKYAYVSGPRDGVRLLRTHNRDLLMQFKYEYDLNGQLVSRALHTQKDSLKWKEFYKFDELMRIQKRIRFDPSRAINNKKGQSAKDPGHLVWGEIFSYDSTGLVLEHKELYDGFVIEITTYRIDSLGNSNKNQEYFDPSLMFRTTYKYNPSGSLKDEISVGRFGRAFKSKNYEYDLYGRNIKVNTFQSDGILIETLNRVYHDTESRITEIQVDSSKKLISRREIHLNRYQRPVVEEHFDDKSRLIQRRNMSYDSKGWLIQIHDYNMLRPGKDDEIIPISIITYEYE